MSARRNSLWLAAIVVCSSIVCCGEAYAQPIWFDRGQEKMVLLEIDKPDFGEGATTTFATVALLLTGRFPAASKIAVVGEIPFAHLGLESGAEGEGHDAIGNPYLGIEIGGRDSRVLGEIGLRLPLASEDESENALFVGYFTELIDRAEAFAPDAFPISGALNYVHRSPDGLVLRLRGGSAAWIATGEREESELFLLYSAQAGFESQGARLVGGLSGRILLSEEDADLGERTLQQFGGACSFRVGSVEPGVSVRIPLDEDLSDTVELVVAFGLGIVLE